VNDVGNSFNDDSGGFGKIAEGHFPGWRLSDKWPVDRLSGSVTMCARSYPIPYTLRFDFDQTKEEMNTERKPEKDRLAKEVIDLWVTFQMALSNKKKYPAAEFNAFAKRVRRYIDAIGRDPLIHRDVAQAINGLVDFLNVERRRVPDAVIYEASRLETLLFSGYDPHFEGDEPPGL